MSLPLDTAVQRATVAGVEPRRTRRRRRPADGGEEVVPACALFVMIGADPCTDWLRGTVDLDEKGFVKTGPDLSSDDLAKAKWPLTRPPYLLETSRPGIFAVGDVRGGNIKRVASAVGEGSIMLS